MKSAHLLLILVLSVVLGGCATILGGSSQILTVNANVSGAEVYLNETLLGTTPLTASLERGQEGVLRVRAEGYQPYQIALNKKISTLFWVNIFSGGVFGSSTDYSTGAMYEYEPATYMVSLQPAEQTAEERNNWQHKEGLRGFVLHNSEAIVTDLATGSGEYIDVLVEVLAVAPEDRAEAIERWRASYVSSVTAIDFAQRIVGEFGN